MKKTIIAMLALSGVAFGAVESGSYTLTTDSAWTLDNATLYNYLNGVFNEGGTLTFDLTINYTGTNCNKYQPLLHVGAKDTGFSIMANGGPNIIVSTKHETGGNYEASTGLTAGSHDVTITLEQVSQGVASVKVSSDGGNPIAITNNLSWGAMNWNADAAERNKYSINCLAPGWNGNGTHDTNTALSKEAISTTLTAGTATYTAAPIPEPTTATLSLLALAGLAARRRRK